MSNRSRDTPKALGDAPKNRRDPNRSESLLCAKNNRRLCFYFTYALWKGADGTTRFGRDDSSAKSKKRNVPSHVQTYGKEKNTNEQNPSKKERKIQFRKREVISKRALFIPIFAKPKSIALHKIP